MIYKRITNILACLVIVSMLTSCNVNTVSKNSPNVVVVLTDDLDFTLMPYMPNTNQLIGQQGATLTNYFATSPLCCPSRASMLCGQYPHNTNILENFPAFRGFYKEKREADTLAVWLNNAGYQTSLLGKYLNLYPIDAGRDYIPPGWNDWHVFLYKKGVSDFYFNYNMNENGHYVEYGNAPQDYSTDVLTQRAIDFINANANKTPFFLLASVYGPHGPSTPAPRHAQMFADLKYPEFPSINEDTSDKPKIIYDLTSAVTGEEVDTGDANSIFIRRARAVQAVDEMVKTIVDTLKKNGILDNTYIIFTSDNGFHIGEHNLPIGKGLPYKEDVHVPFLVRGPGIKPNSQITQFAANIDIAPTVAEMTSVKPSNIVDGRSLLPLLRNEPVSEWRNVVLVELGYIDKKKSSSGMQNIAFKPADTEKLVAEYPDTKYDNYLSETTGGTFRSIYTDKFSYAEYENGEKEYYDLIKDPYQLDNLAGRIDADTLTRLHSWLGELKACQAESCRTAEEKIIEGFK